ncbi:MAG: DUF1552 domain-containing protein [Planctomycetales bacterium]|nr:DUF1552 domain-containing protein [Planctomycetales bacterium]
MKGDTHISRRTVLRGFGAALSLPLLEAMTRRTARGAAVGEAPRRMAFIYVPNGIHMPDWTPAAEGKLDALPSILAPLEKHKRELLVLSGLTLNGARALGDGGGDHARSVAAFLTGAHPLKTGGTDIRNGVSVDQLAAEAIGSRTRFASLELGCEPSAKSGNCDSGYSCIYSSNMSWRSPTQPMSKEINPRSVFDRLFGNESPAELAKSKALRQANHKSVLDFVQEDARRLERQLGAKDRQKLGEYFEAVRDIERRTAEADKLAAREPDVPDYPRPAGVPSDKAEHVRLMFDMMTLAMRTDSTRVLSMMITNAGSNRSYPDIGVSDGHHNLSHHGNDPEKQAKISKINRHHVSLLAHFLDGLAAVEDGEGSLLDHSMIVYGSGIGDGNRHNHHDLPILVAGQGRGALSGGRHVQYPQETPLTNLYLSLLDAMDAPVKSMGDSTGRLDQLRG